MFYVHKLYTCGNQFKSKTSFGIFATASIAQQFSILILLLLLSYFVETYTERIRSEPLVVLIRLTLTYILSVPAALISEKEHKALKLGHFIFVTCS